MHSTIYQFVNICNAVLLIVGSPFIGVGFLSLEEIDETEFGLEIPKDQKKGREKKLKENTKSKKRKKSEGDEALRDLEEGENEELEKEEQKDQENQVRQDKRKRKKKKKENSKQNNSVNNGAEGNSESVAVTPSKDDHIEDSKNNDADDLVDDSEYYAWKELRLHPLLIKSIMRLEFKEPTPIQKGCFHAAAHQGKVDI